MRKFRLLLAGILFLSMFSCKDESPQAETSPGDDRIRYNVNIPGAFQTRGTPVNSANDTIFKTIGIMGYQTTEPWDKTSDPESGFLSNKELTKTSNNHWQFDHTIFWPQKGSISFFAYAPYATQENGITIKPVQTGSPTLTYQVPSGVADQPDLMVAAPQKDKYKELISLSFSHALACIAFDVSGEQVPIDSIGIKGVFTTGTLMLDMSENTPEWTDLSGDTNEFFKVGLIENASATNPAENIMATNGYLMMIPQTLSDEAAIIVKFKGMAPKTIALKNAGVTTWKAGSKYLYSLKEGVYELTVTSDTYQIPYTGGEFNLDITSKYTRQDGVVEYPGWTAKIIDNTTGETQWFSGFSGLTDQPGGINLSRILTAGLSSFSPSSVNDQYLQNQPEIDSTDMKDLSFVENYYASANCYVVNGPGWYKFPCWVMGNGMNSATSSRSNSASLNNKCFPGTSPLFVDYKGDSIRQATDLMLTTAGAKASLMWMDAPELITRIAMTDDGDYIRFYVGPETIRQGNAVIALYAPDGTIMWSWHIWVNEWTLTYPESPSYTKYFGNSLGVCYPSEYNYRKRSVTLEFTQNQSNQTTEITLTQDTMSIRAYLNAPFYQWGRKDPIPGSDGIAQNKPCYGPEQRKTASGPVNLQTAIQHPNVFYTTAGSWYNTNGAQLWGANALDFAKTIYDPCPIGNMVPAQKMLEGLTPTQWFPTYPGYGFVYGDHSTVIFMLFGLRNQSSGNLEDITTTGYYWSNSNDNQTNKPYRLEMDQGGVTTGSANTANGFSIMPVQNNQYPPNR